MSQKKKKTTVPSYLTLMNAIRDSQICKGSLAKRITLENLLSKMDFNTWEGAPSYATLAGICDVNIQTVQRMMSSLVKSGVVKRVVRPNRSNRYTVRWQLILDKADYEYRVADDGEFALISTKAGRQAACKFKAYGQERVRLGQETAGSGNPPNSSSPQSSSLSEHANFSWTDLDYDIADDI